MLGENMTSSSLIRILLLCNIPAALIFISNPIYLYVWVILPVGLIAGLSILAGKLRWVFFLIPTVFVIYYGIAFFAFFAKETPWFFANTVFFSAFLLACLANIKLLPGRDTV